MTHNISTALIHHPYRPPADFDAPQPGLFKASTVFFPNVAALEAREWRDKSGYTYGLHGTPTTFILEERIATLEGGLQCLLVPSGLAAIACVSFAFLKSGDEVMLPDNVYGPSKALADAELRAMGVSCKLYDPMEVDSFAAAITSRTRLIWLEAPGSVTMEFPDLLRLAKICRDKGVISALDNTWGAGLAFNPFALDDAGTSVDLSVHALTKYPSGGGDVLMGSLVTRNPEIHMRMKMTHMRMGFGVGMNDAEAVLRALPSIALRYDAQDKAARDLAMWLASREEVAQVFHPALAGSPGHAHWRALCGPRGKAAGIFSIVFNERFSRADVHAFCDALTLFRIGYSWGGPVSLVVPYDIGTMRDSSVTTWTYAPTLVRLCIGLEGVEDLRLDLTHALATLRAAR